MKGYIDIHSHVLPGLDDGSQSMEQSLAMLRIACEQGIETIVATPHNMPGKGRPDRERVEEEVRRLQKAAVERGIPVRLSQGCEYYYRDTPWQFGLRAGGIRRTGRDALYPKRGQGDS